jgi:hypothetical protein
MTLSPNANLNVLLTAAEKHARLRRNFNNYQRNHPNWNQTYATFATQLAALETRIRRLIQNINRTHNLNMRRGTNIHSEINNAMRKLIMKIRTVNNLARR